ncbi:hypothetical protein CDCA_CDCA03G1107 [Cyanidium caldarium]|uniref:Glutaredoxin domain-containing protein n=1 Tax=Cyanidium caldarium TaxID=2771 RepID=A0AAV9IS08_CYACA|nr:hypothetical protein CDCA_CDCA03G1107 [Cyanidium caldarium]
MSPTGTLPTGSTVEKWLQTLPPSQPTVLFLFASEPESGRRASEAVYAALRACQSAYAQLRCVSLDVATDSDASGPTVATLLRAYAVESAPTVLYFASGAPEPSERVVGAWPARVSAAAERLVQEDAEKQARVRARIERLLASHPVMLFMKGTPETPRCGFSKQMVQLLMQEMPLPTDSLGTFDILEDEEIRQGLKAYANWPTYPQLYVKGELLGGLDICRQLASTGELQKVVREATSSPN